MWATRWPAGVLTLLLIGTTASAAAEIDPLVPNEAQFLCTIRVSQVLHSSLFKQYALPLLRPVLESERAQQMLEALGLDPLQDVRRVTAALTTGGDHLVIIRGHFDTARIEGECRECCRGRNPLLRSYSSPEGPRIYELRSQEKETAESGSIRFGWNGEVGESVDSLSGCPCLQLNGPLFFCVIDKRTVVVGSSREIAEATLSRAAEKGRPALSRELLRLIRQVDTRASLWVVEQIPPGATAAADAETEEEAEEVPCPLTSYAGSIQVGDDVRIKLILRAADAAGARELAAGVEDLRTRARGLSALLTGTQKDLAILRDVPRAIQVSRCGRVVTVEGHLPAGLFKLLDQLLVPEE
jgi:hypothetical protein